MTVFSYTACTAEGRKIHGIIEAESAPAAARMLMERGETAVHIEERRTLRLPQETRQWLSRRGGVTDEERIAFFQELSALLAVGLPMHRALERLRDGVGEASPSGRLLHDLHHAAMQGMPLSRAMETKQQIFSPVLVGMVRAGEESGSLDVVLGAAASFLTEEHRMREALWSALLYPLFLLVAVVLSIALMTVFILPIFAALLADLHADLPLPTQLLLTASAQIADAPAATVFVLLAVPLSIGLLLRIPSVRFLCDRCILRLPVVGVFIRCRAWQMILCVLAVLLRSGIRLDRAIALACTATGNRALRRQLCSIEQRLIEGRSLTQIMADDPYLPPLVRGMLAAGEEAGELERILPQAAEYCARRAEIIGQRVAALAEPIMIVVVAGLIFFAVLSFLLPIFDAMDAMM